MPGAYQPFPPTWKTHGKLLTDRHRQIDRHTHRQQTEMTDRWASQGIGPQKGSIKETTKQQRCKQIKLSPTNVKTQNKQKSIAKNSEIICSLQTATKSEIGSYKRGRKKLQPTNNVYTAYSSLFSPLKRHQVFSEHNNGERTQQKKCQQLFPEITAAKTDCLHACEVK